MWYLWILTKAIVMLCLYLPTTKVYMDLIGMVIIWKSILAIHILQSQTSDPKRVKLYNQIKMCMCVDVCGGYIWWLTYFYYAPWKHISLLKLRNNFARKHGPSYSSLSFFRRALEYPLFSISRTLVHFFLSLFLFFYFLMKNFCIAPCLFSATELWEIATRT